MALDQYLEMSGTDPETFTEELREAATQAAKADLALRAVGVAESIEVTDEQLDAELLELAGQLDQDLDEVRQQLDESDQLGAIRSDIQKRNALEWLLDQVDIVDPDGNPIDREALESHDSDEQAPTATHPEADSESDLE